MLFESVCVVGAPHSSSILHVFIFGDYLGGGTWHHYVIISAFFPDFIFCKCFGRGDPAPTGFFWLGVWAGFPRPLSAFSWSSSSGPFPVLFPRIYPAFIFANLLGGETPPLRWGWGVIVCVGGVLLG